MLPRIVAIDPGVLMGVAWSEDGVLHPDRSALWDLRGVEEYGPRYLDIKNRFLALGVRPTHVAFEFTFFKSYATNVWFMGYRAIWQMLAAHVDAEFLLVQQSTLKKFATGRGRATKEEREADRDIEKKQLRAALQWRYPDYDFGAVEQDRIDAMWVHEWAKAQLLERSAA